MSRMGGMEEVSAEMSKRIKICVGRDDEALEARHVGKVKSGDIDPVTGEHIDHYESVDVRHRFGDWQNLWLTPKEYSRGLEKAAALEKKAQIANDLGRRSDRTNRRRRQTNMDRER